MEEQQKLLIYNSNQQLHSEKNLRKIPLDKQEVHLTHNISKENAMARAYTNGNNPSSLLLKQKFNRVIQQPLCANQIKNNSVQSKHQHSLQPICQNVELCQVTNFTKATGSQSRQNKGYNSKITDCINKNSRRLLYQSTIKHSLRSDLLSSDRYNQIQDNYLIQYLYTRKNKLLDSLLHKQNDIPKKVQSKNKQMMKKDLHKSNPQLRIRKQKANKTFQVKKHYNRDVNFNNFDLISCSQSLKLGPTKISHIKKKKKQSNNQNKGQFWQQFQQKINKLEQNIYTKVPYLVQMGVQFKIRK